MRRRITNTVATAQRISQTAAAPHTAPWQEAVSQRDPGDVGGGEGGEGGGLGEGGGDDEVDVDHGQGGARVILTLSSVPLPPPLSSDRTRPAETASKTSAMRKCHPTCSLPFTVVPHL